jgi:hypothetical protein
MDVKRLLLIFIALSLFLTTPAFAATNTTSTAEWIIQTVYPNGVIAPNATVTIVQNGATVLTATTNSSGMLVAYLQNVSSTITASLDGYSNSITAPYAGFYQIVIPVPAPPLGTVSLGSSITLTTPGGLEIQAVNPPPNMIEKIIVSQAYDEPYIATVQNGLVTFQTNETNSYLLNITFDYPGAPQWREIIVSEYSQYMQERLTIPFYVFASNVSILLSVITIVGPHYPTPQEIAAALAQTDKELLQNFSTMVEQNITATVVPPINKNTGQIQSLTGSVSTLQDTVQGLNNYVAVQIANLNQAFASWEANGWTTLALIATIFLILIAAVYYSFSHRHEEVVSLDESEIPKPKEQKEQLEIEKTAPKAKRTYRPAGIVLIAVGAITLLIFYTQNPSAYINSLLHTSMTSTQIKNDGVIGGIILLLIGLFMVRK